MNRLVAQSQWKDIPWWAPGEGGPSWRRLLRGQQLGAGRPGPPQGWGSPAGPSAPSACAWPWCPWGQPPASYSPGPPPTTCWVWDKQARITTHPCWIFFHANAKMCSDTFHFLMEYLRFSVYVCRKALQKINVLIVKMFTIISSGYCIIYCMMVTVVVDVVVVGIQPLFQHACCLTWTEGVAPVPALGTHWVSPCPWRSPPQVCPRCNHCPGDKPGLSACCGLGLRHTGTEDTRAFLSIKGFQLTRWIKSVSW